MSAPRGIHVGVWAPYQEVTGDTIRFNQLLRLLSQIKIDNVLIVAAQVNWFLQKYGMKPEVQKTLAQRFVEPPLLLRIDQWHAKQTPRSISLPCIFHRQQLLALMRWVGTVCTDAGHDLDDDRTFVFGKACLMMNDFLHPGDIPEEWPVEQRKIELLAQFLPTYELSNPPKLVNSVVRAFHLATHILPKLPNGAKYLERFREATGFELLRYVALMFGLWATLYVPDEEELKRGGFLTLDPATSFRQGSVPQAEWEKLLIHEAVPVRDLPDRIYSLSRNNPKYDFRIFRQWPLVQMNDGRFFCLDLGFLADRMSQGVYWTIHEALASEDRQQFAADWGKAFEVYVKEALADMYSTSSGIFLSQPRMRNGKELADGMPYNGPILVLLEVKGSFLTMEARCSGQSYLALRDIGEKFVKRGVHQLAGAVRRICSPAQSADLQAMGVNPDDLQLVIPVLVALEASVESPFVGWYLNQEFQKKVQDLDNPRRLKIGPLVVLSAEELEDIEANRDPLGIFEMLKRKGAEDPLHTDSFHIFANQHLWAKSARNERIAAQFDGLFDEVVTLLFGKQGAAARRRDDHRRDHPVA